MKTTGRYEYLNSNKVFTEVYSPDNKPTKNDVGLSNVDNVRQYSINNPPPAQKLWIHNLTFRRSGGFKFGDYSAGAPYAVCTIIAPFKRSLVGSNDINVQNCKIISTQPILLKANVANAPSNMYMCVIISTISRSGSINGNLSFGTNNHTLVIYDKTYEINPITGIELYEDIVSEYAWSEGE